MLVFNIRTLLGPSVQKEVETEVPVSTTTGEEGNFVLKCMIPYMYRNEGYCLCMITPVLGYVPACLYSLLESSKF